MATQKRNSVEGLSISLASSLDEHLSVIRVRIADRAYELATQSNLVAGEGLEEEKVQVNLNNLSQATNEIIAGQQSLQISRIGRFFEYFSPFTCVCSILCIAFAVLGLQALHNGGGTEIAKSTSTFLDIAKIFAGAIIGSTASTSISATKNRRQSR